MAFNFLHIPPAWSTGKLSVSLEIIKGESSQNDCKALSSDVVILIIRRHPQHNDLTITIMIIKRYVDNADEDQLFSPGGRVVWSSHSSPGKRSSPRFAWPNQCNTTCPDSPPTPVTHTVFLHLRLKRAFQGSNEPKNHPSRDSSHGPTKHTCQDSSGRRGPVVANHRPF